jgi:hypothetical protein
MYRYGAVFLEKLRVHLGKPKSKKRTGDDSKASCLCDTPDHHRASLSPCPLPPPGTHTRVSPRLFCILICRDGGTRSDRE